MRRIAAILALVVGALALVITGVGAEEGDGYEVRAAFDNGGFVVAGEEVRIAGARVGEVESVGVSLGDEAVHADGSPEPGKAIIVMRIDDPGFQDFRADASCLIRPQSLLGEKFVDCEPTQPRAPGSPEAPELDVIPDGEPGEGQRLLPVENNGKAVDLDLVNNIMREPYPDRFRLILNDLGAGLAARGEELEEIILRGNPALRETNEVLAILAGQSSRLEELARDGDRSLSPLARERESLSSFINQATVAGEATAERGAELEENFQKLPPFLRELRPTMSALADFSDQAAPVLSDLGDAAPSLTRSTRALGPFTRAGTRALRSLGRAGEDATPDLVASQPVIRDLGGLADNQAPMARQLRRLLRDLRTSGGTEALMRLLYSGAGSVNGFDDFGHYVRAIVPVNNCFGYEINPEAGCDANFTRTFAARAQRAPRRERSAADAPEAPSVSGRGRSREGLETVLDFLIGSPGREEG